MKELYEEVTFRYILNCKVTCTWWNKSANWVEGEAILSLLGYHIRAIEIPIFEYTLPTYISTTCVKHSVFLHCQSTLTMSHFFLLFDILIILLKLKKILFSDL